jgi:hypothetical protein
MTDDVLEHVGEEMETIPSDGRHTMNREPTTTESLTVTGPTSLTDTTIAGTLMVGGELTLAGNTINTTTPQKPLEIQSHAQSPVQFMGGLVEFFTDGSIKTEGDLEVGGNITSDRITSSDTFAGRVTIPEGQMTFTVEKTWEQEPKTIILTANTNIDVWYKDLSEHGFTIHLDEKSIEDVDVNWIVVW